MTEEGIHNLQNRLHTALDGLRRHLSSEARSASPVFAPSSDKPEMKSRLQEVYKALESAKVREDQYQGEISLLRSDLESLRTSYQRKQHALDLLQSSLDKEVSIAQEVAKVDMHAKTEELGRKLGSLQEEFEGASVLHEQTIATKDARIKELETAVDLLTRTSKRQAEEIVRRDAKIVQMTSLMRGAQRIDQSVMDDEDTQSTPRPVAPTPHPSYSSLPVNPPTISRFSQQSVWPELALQSHGKQDSALRPSQFAPPVPNRQPFPAPQFTNHLYLVQSGAV